MKLAVFFPGIGYSNDMPLLYYTRKMASNLGYDFIKIDYQSIYPITPELLADEERIEKFIKKEARDVERRMREVEISRYDEIVFVSKSIGTVIASIYDSAAPFSARHLMFTPLIQAFENHKHSGSLVFYTDADPYQESGEIEDACQKEGVKSVLIENTNHSLETGNTLEDLERMKLIMNIVKKYLMKKE